ncbi:MAG: helix-turn-helix domain-containing protein [Candidatus Firestonebacteria bacterium]
MSYKRLLKVEEVAECLGLGKQTLYNMVSERKIPFVKLGKSLRFDVKDIDALIERGRVEVVNE